MRLDERRHVLIAYFTEHRLRDERLIKQIGEELNNHKRWGAHSRGITMEVLRNDDKLRLKIDDYSEDAKLKDLVHQYFWLLKDLSTSSLVYTRAYL